MRRFRDFMDYVCDAAMCFVAGLLLVAGAFVGVFLGVFVEVGEFVWCGVKWVSKALRRLNNNNNNNNK